MLWRIDVSTENQWMSLPLDRFYRLTDKYLIPRLSQVVNGNGKWRISQVIIIVKYLIWSGIWFWGLISQVVNGKWWILQVIIMVTGARLTPPHCEWNDRSAFGEPATSWTHILQLIYKIDKIVGKRTNCMFIWQMCWWVGNRTGAAHVLKVACP